jgi:hypothetical protein
VIFVITWVQLTYCEQCTASLTTLKSFTNDASAAAAAVLLLLQALDYTAAFTAAVAGLAAFNAQGALAACSSSGEAMRVMRYCAEQLHASLPADAALHDGICLSCACLAKPVAWC